MNNKWMEYQRGLCTDEEYMKYVYNGYIGKVTKNNHDYYIFSNFLGSEK